MTNDDKALVKRLRQGHEGPAADRIEALSAENERLLDIDEVKAKAIDNMLNQLANAEQENERLREKLIGIRAEIDDMENPFNGGAFVDAEYGFETAVDQAVNIVTAALENSNDRYS